MLAQTPSQSVAGEYYLNGVMETASGFRVNADSTFEFFFSQGALDRQGRHNAASKSAAQEAAAVLNKRPPRGGRTGSRLAHDPVRKPRTFRDRALFQKHALQELDFLAQ